VAGMPFCAKRGVGLMEDVAAIVTARMTNVMRREAIV
jgi:hypothetical protein